MNEDQIINFGKSFMKTPATLFKIVLLTKKLKKITLWVLLLKMGYLLLMNKNC